MKNIETPKWQMELQRIANRSGGIINPEDVVESARNKKSPLHSKFTWEDSVAAHQFRLIQARNLIRVVVTVIPNSKITERVYVSLNNDRGEGGYRPIVNVLADPVLREDLLSEAKAELERFREKYGRLKELAGIFEAIKKLK